MKKLIVLLMASLFSISLVFGQNKERVTLLNKAEEEIKEEIKEAKIKENHEEVKMKERELKSVKEELKKLEGDNVNNTVKESFYDDFGNIADVIWERNEYYDIATFTSDGNTKKAFYDFDSQLIGSTSFFTFADLPERAQKKINHKYKDYEIGQVIFYDDNESVDVNFLMYEQEFSHEDNFFVELTKNSRHIIVKVDMEGDVSYFKSM